MTWDWSPISAAPRDGTPVILWLEEDEMPPVFTQPVGFWIVDPPSRSRLLAAFWRSPTLLLGQAYLRMAAMSS
jgi:hypothetical protein